MKKAVSFLLAAVMLLTLAPLAGAGDRPGAGPGSGRSGPPPRWPGASVS